MMRAHWDYILAAYGVAFVAITAYRLLLGRWRRAAEAERDALRRAQVR